MAKQKNNNWQKSDENSAVTKDINAKKNSKKKLISFRWYFLFPLAFLILLSYIFIGWQLQPNKKLNVCLIDKTVPTADTRNAVDTSAFYRKHQGFYWLLEQQKYTFQDGSFYDYKTDYFGPQLGDNMEVESVRETTSIDYIPNLMYIADVYGSELYKNEINGLNSDDMSVISHSHVNGATVIAEMEMFGSTDDSTVYMQMSEMCGVVPTTWVGRYIYDLQDFSDVPYWAPPMYEQQEGVEWQLSGPGILLVSSEGKIIVLEEKTHFNSKNLLTIYITDEYKKEFKSCSTANFYNWFEIVETNYDAETIAMFEFDVNAQGMEKIRDVMKTPRFVAVTRKKYENRSPVYFFAGDFNDYVSKLNYNRFLFSDVIYRSISYDRSGDISNFYWNFYTPLMKKILKDIKTEINAGEKYHKEEKNVEKEHSRIENNKFSVLINDEWADFSIKGVNVNANAPGEIKYTRDFYTYQHLIKEAADLGANCIRVYDIMPTEFYQALYEYNVNRIKNYMYVIQSIVPPDGLSKQQFTTIQGQEQLKNQIVLAIEAIHGKGSIDETEKRYAAKYLNNVSPYLLAYTVDLKLSTSEAKALLLQEDIFSYSGKYLSSKNNSIEALYAMMCDFAMTYHNEAYGYIPPISSTDIAELLNGTTWISPFDYSYNTNNISVNDQDVRKYFFTSVSLMPNEKHFLDNKQNYFDSSDEDGAFPYLGYVTEVKNAIDDREVLVSRVGLSVNTNLFLKDTDVNGLTEKEQGYGISRMLDALDEVGFVGSFIADLNDTWSEISSDQYAFTVPTINNYLWHNMLDSAQTTGIVAYEAERPTEIGLELNDLDWMQQVHFSSNPEYFYFTIQLNREVNYEKEKMFIGLDTYQRNDGEYMYDMGFYANSLSGMEFLIKFQSKTDAALYVVPSYNRNMGKLASKESYDANYDLVTNLVYGNFSLAENHFYQTGSTIYVRIPWGLLNITDPSQKVVAYDSSEEIGEQVRTITTNGIMFSLFIGDIVTKDTLCIFPKDKQSTGYKSYNWKKWESVKYTFREKESYKIISNYFNQKQ